MKLLISIVTHNQASLVQSLLDSIDLFLKSELHEVLIVITENDLYDHNLNSKNFKVTHINNLRKKGFGDNHNSVFEKFDSDFFFIINPDIILKEEFNLDLIVEHLVEEEIDISSPQVFNHEGIVEDYKRADLSFLNLCKRKLLKNNLENFDWLAGMFLIIKSDSFRKIKGFDTNYFMYVEDCDLCMRAREAGLRINDIDDFSVVHNARRSSANNIEHLIWHISSILRYWFIRKVTRIINYKN